MCDVCVCCTAASTATTLVFVTVIPAIEILSDPVKRRAFDSVDPTFDNTVPSKAEGKEKFFEVFAPVFERNARSVSSNLRSTLKSLKSLDTS